jgi:hypothetical protein
MFGWAVGSVDVIGIGYQATFVGAIIGAIWAFVDGYVGSLIVVWLYSKFTK